MTPEKMETSDVLSKYIYPFVVIQLCDKQHRKCYCPLWKKYNTESLM